jgi:hypothetical protein
MPQVCVRVSSDGYTRCIRNNLIPHRRRARSFQLQFSAHTLHSRVWRLLAQESQVHTEIKAARLQWKKEGRKSCALFAALLAKVALS